MNDLKGGAWSYMRNVRRMAISVQQEVDNKDTHIRWPDISGNISTIDYIEKRFGQGIYHHQRSSQLVRNYIAASC